MADISSLLKSTGLDLERTATEVFGNAVEDFSRGNIEPALRGLFGQPEEQAANRNDGSWYATSYAHNLANSNFRPKLKFLFRVEFLFKPEIIAQYPELKNNQFVFLIRSVDRPKVDFDYEEINRYNFRSKVLKMIKHRELTITFMDDVGNSVYNFFRIMMMVHSPITRRSATASHDIAAQVAAYATGNGMLFTDQPGVANDFASRGAINTDIGNVIQAIKVTQMFVQPQPGAGALDSAAKEVAFFFMNPRIVSFDLDDLNHEVSEANLFTMQFDYDFMIMAPMKNLEAIPAEKAVPPLRGAPSEPAPTGRATGTSTQGGGGDDSFTRLIGAVAGRTVSRVVASTIGRNLRQIPGLANATTVLSGLVGNTVTSAVTSAVGGIPQSLSRASRGLVSDSTVIGSPRAGFNVSTGSFPLSTPAITPSDD